MLQIGDEVKWVRVRRNGNKIRFKQMYGTLLSLQGQSATVRLKNGRRETIDVECLRHSTKEPGLLTELIRSLGSEEPTT